MNQPPPWQSQYGQQPWNQQQPYQQPYYYSPSMMQPPGQPPPKKRMSAWKIALLVIGLILACGIVNVIIKPQSSSTANNPPDATTTTPQTTVSTSQGTPTTKRTTPVPIYPTAPGDAILGANIGTFVGKYGQPDPRSDQKGNQYGFQPYGDTQLDFLDVLVVGQGLFDRKYGPVPAKYAHVVTDVAANAPPPDQLWDVITARATCSVFLPPDSQYERHIQRTDSGGDLLDIRIYHSQLLSTEIPASEFVDENINHIQPGTFAVTYYYSGNKVTICEVGIGEGPNA